jgi:tRNA U34 5-methylaminomethyl-2-thiouridine-forming methyltransferase MnmC
MAITVLTTGDHSPTLYNEELDETYHSRNGAIEESRHVFLKMGLEEALKTKTELAILEIGFGTGLNAILTLTAGLGNVFYHSLETFPLPLPLVESMNYHDFLNEQEYTLFLEMHKAPWNEGIPVREGFELFKEEVSVHAWQATKQYNLVYFDAFGPDKQPDMWTREVFEKICNAMAENGILVTYSCKGVIRRMLQDIGFKVERLPGPPGKRHMLRATK